MKTLRSICLPVLILASATPAIANEVWSLSGFKAPESVLLDSQRNVLYVSNVAGEANAKDGVGFISKVSPDGKMIEAEWVKGLNAPKGLVMNGDKLYVSDVDQLVEIDVTKGQVTNSWKAEGSKFLNDTAVNSTGRVYVSDMLADSIYVLENGSSFGLSSRSGPAAPEWFTCRRRQASRGCLGSGHSARFLDQDSGPSAFCRPQDKGDL